MSPRTAQLASDSTARERLLRRLLAEAQGDLTKHERMSRDGFDVRFELARDRREIEAYESDLRALAREQERVAA